MRKLLISLIFILIFMSLAAFAFLSFYDGKYSVTEKTTIRNSADIVFEKVSDVREVVKWSPWTKLDSKAIFGYSDDSNSVKSYYTWSGNHKIGKGKLTNILLDKNKRISQKVEMKKPKKYSFDQDWIFNKIDDDNTEVIWQIKGESSDGISDKIFAYFANNILSSMMNDGLSNLKKSSELVIKKKEDITNKSVVSKPAKEVLFNKEFVGNPYYVTTDFAEIQKTIKVEMPRFQMFLRQNNFDKSEYRLASVLKDWDSKNNSVTVFVGAIMDKKIKLSDDLKRIYLPKKVLKIINKGSYTSSKNAHINLKLYRELNGFKSRNIIWEEYISDFEKSNDIDFQTNIYYSVY